MFLFCDLTIKCFCSTDDACDSIDGEILGVVGGINSVSDL